MTTRRGFLELGAKVAAAGCVLGRGSYALPPVTKVPGMTYGVQMFMVRRQAATDLAGAFRAIKKAGFDQVELYPIAYKQPAAALKQMLGDTGLTSVAGHFDYTGRAMSVEYAHALGLKYLVCPMLPKEQWGSLDGFKQAAEYFSQWAEATHKAGMQFAFHNHDYEFKPMSGSTGFAELMRGTDAKLVKLEMDVYWLTQGGQDPAAMLAKYADRAVLLHMKDREAGAPVSYDMEKGAEHFRELGKGSLDWPGLLAQARRQGIRYAFLDQDETAGPVEESMKASRDYLRTIKG